MLTFAQNKIWQSGYFRNSTRWYYCCVRADGTIVTPHGYDVLVGCKIGFDPVPIRDEFFMFAQNGPVAEPDENTKFTKQVQFMGSYPTLIGFYSDVSNHNRPFKIGVTSPNSPNYDEYPMAVISGKGTNGRPIYSYGKSRNYEIASESDIEELNEIRSQLGDSYYTDSDILQGIQMPITNKMMVRDEICLSEIINIAKDPTLADVDFYAVYQDRDTGVLLARMGPFETSSSYNIYKINAPCVRDGQAFCLLKMKRPDKIVSDGQFFITDNENAYIDMIKHVYHQHWRNDFQQAALFYQSAINALGMDVNSNTPARSIQINMDNAVEKARRKRKWL